MIARLVSVAVLLSMVQTARSQCGHWSPYPPVIILVPVYPAPSRPRPPENPTTPPLKNGAVRESTLGTGEPPIAKKAEASPKPREAATIPKLKPPLPEDLAEGTPKIEKPAEEARKVDQYLVPADEKVSRPGPQVRVGFFNHSEREILLVVSGEQVKLPPEQYVTMRLTRTFTWAERGGKSREVVVPPDADGVEIVFRK